MVFEGAVFAAPFFISQENPVPFCIKKIRLLFVSKKIRLLFCITEKSGSFLYHHKVRLFSGDARRLLYLRSKL